MSVDVSSQTWTFNDDLSFNQDAGSVVGFTSNGSSCTGMSVTANDDGIWLQYNIDGMEETVYSEDSIIPTAPTWTDNGYKVVTFGANATISDSLYSFLTSNATCNNAVNKVVAGSTTLIDLTADTVTEADVAAGRTFHLASGVQATGTATGGAKVGVVHLGTVTSVYTGVQATKSGTVLQIGG